MQMRRDRFPHLSDEEWLKMRAELIEIASAHGF
jgi:hypothetical protein